MTALPSVLLLGIDTPIGLTVIRELGERGVPLHGIGRDNHAIGAASRWIASASARGEGPLVQWLPERIRATGAKALMAISEGDLVELAALSAEIEGCRILAPRAGPLGVVLDKARTLDAARGVGIAVPESWQPAPDDQNCPLSYPLVAKWSDPPAIAAALSAHGLPLLKAEQLADRDALDAMLARYAPLDQWPLVQSFVPGHGVGQMLHMADGRATLRFQHRRLHEWPVTGGTSTMCEALPPDCYPEQMAKSEALLAAIGWEGPAMVEYRHDPATGAFVLMETNGRFWGSLPLARHSGAHFAWEQYARAFDIATAAEPQRRVKARFMVPETRRLLHILRHGGGEGRAVALWRYLTGFLDPAMRYYVFEWRDPGPMRRDLANIIRRAVRRDSAQAVPAPPQRSAAPSSP